MGGLRKKNYLRSKDSHCKRILSRRYGFKYSVIHIIECLTKRLRIKDGIYGKWDKFVFDSLSFSLIILTNNIYLILRYKRKGEIYLKNKPIIKKRFTLTKWYPKLKRSVLDK